MVMLRLKWGWCWWCRAFAESVTVSSFYSGIRLLLCNGHCCLLDFLCQGVLLMTTCRPIWFMTSSSIFIVLNSESIVRGLYEDCANGSHSGNGIVVVNPSFLHIPLTNAMWTGSIDYIDRSVAIRRYRQVSFDTTDTTDTTAVEGILTYLIWQR